MMKRQWMRVLLVAALAVAVTAVVGCKKEEGTSTTTTTKTAMNTKCPVCGMSVGDNAVTAEVEGQKVAFCSEGCKEKCLAAPEEFKKKVEGVMKEAQETAHEGMERVEEGAEEAGKKLDEMKKGVGM